MTARFVTRCPKCKLKIRIGAEIDLSLGRARHKACVKPKAAPVPETPAFRGAPPERDLEDVLARI